MKKEKRLSIWSNTFESKSAISEQVMEISIEADEVKDVIESKINDNNLISPYDSTFDESSLGILVG
ncbi:MAG: hypothetical protein ACRBCI_14225 [Cellvibrionaceae bacterium]